MVEAGLLEEAKMILLVALQSDSWSRSALWFYNLRETNKPTSKHCTVPLSVEIQLWHSRGRCCIRELISLWVYMYSSNNTTRLWLIYIIQLFQLMYEKLLEPQCSSIFHTSSLSKYSFDSERTFSSPSTGTCWNRHILNPHESDSLKYCLQYLRYREGGVNTYIKWQTSTAECMTDFTETSWTSWASCSTTKYTILWKWSWCKTSFEKNKITLSFNFKSVLSHEVILHLQHTMYFIMCR